MQFHVALTRDLANILTIDQNRSLLGSRHDRTGFLIERLTRLLVLDPVRAMVWDLPEAISLSELACLLLRQIEHHLNFGLSFFIFSSDAPSASKSWSKKAGRDSRFPGSRMIRKLTRLRLAMKSNRLIHIS